MTIIVRCKTEKETDLLTGREGETVRVTCLDGIPVAYFTAPESGWSVEKLEALGDVLSSMYGEWDASLGDEWIGSSEV